MQVTSTAQADAFELGVTPPIEQIRPGVFAIPVRMPRSWLPYSFSYVLEHPSGSLHVVDVGIDSDENWKAFQRDLAEIGHRITDVQDVTITHLHTDHAGLAARVRAASGARIGMHRADAAAMHLRAPHVPEAVIEQSLVDWDVPVEFWDDLRAAAATKAASGPECKIDILYEGGESIDLSGRAGRLLRVPGHTTGHLAVVDETDRLVFTGDALLPRIHPAVELARIADCADPLGDYFRSLDTLSALVGYEVCPGHGYRFVGIEQRCAATARHHRRRASEVAAVIAGDPTASLWEVASRVSWAAGWDNLRQFHLLSALCQTAMHAASAAMPTLKP